MIEIYRGAELEALRRAGRVAAQTLDTVCRRVEAGVTTAQIDRWVQKDTAERGGRPSQLGYQGFPAAVCTSRNHVVCHGIPNKDEVLAEGDLLNIDVTTEIGGFHGDCSRTVLIGAASPRAREIARVAEVCMWAGIHVIRPGARLGDIGAAIVEEAQKNDCTVVRELCGHGIGRRMHQEPQVPHVGRRGQGLRLRAGMVLTVEPMINQGRADVIFLGDGWTVVTADGSLSAQFEHTVLVTETGFEILTQPPTGAGG